MSHLQPALSHLVKGNSISPACSGMSLGLISPEPLPTTSHSSANLLGVVPYWPPLTTLLPRPWSKPPSRHIWMIVGTYRWPPYLLPALIGFQHSSQGSPVYTQSDHIPPLVISPDSLWPMWMTGPRVLSDLRSYSPCLCYLFCSQPAQAPYEISYTCLSSVFPDRHVTSFLASFWPFHLLVLHICCFTYLFFYCLLPTRMYVRSWWGFLPFGHKCLAESSWILSEWKHLKRPR